MNHPFAANPAPDPGGSLPVAADLPLTARGRYRHVPVVQWLASGIVLVALAVVAVPAFSGVFTLDARNKALFQAKQIGLALKLFAGDNDGIYPREGTPTQLHSVATSNAAFAVVFPAYTQSEKLFGNALSAYQTHPPDDVIDTTYMGEPINTLTPGENVYAYMKGLEDSFNPACPLVVDGTDGTGHYVTDSTKRGGVWGGAEAIVVRLDDAAALEPLAGPENARYVPLGDALAERFHGKPDDNLLEVRRWGGTIRLLEPAVAKGK